MRCVVAALSFLLLLAAHAGAAELPRTGSVFGQTAAVSPLGHVATLGRESIADRAWFAAPGAELGPAVPVPGGHLSAIALGPQGEALIAYAEGGSDGRFMTSFRPPGGAFEPPIAIADKAPAGEPAGVAFDAAGSATVLWTAQQSGEDLVARTRAPDGTWSDPELVPEARGSFEARLVVAPDGTATAAWREIEPGGRENANRLVVATRPPGGRFSDRQIVASSAHEPANAVLAANARGDAVLAWVQLVEDERAKDLRASVSAAFRRGTGRFGRPTPLARRRTLGCLPSVSVAPSGRMVVAFADCQHAQALVRIRTAAGRLLPVRTLTADLEGTTGPAALAVGSGIVAWYDRDPGRSILRFAIVLPDGRLDRLPIASGAWHPEVPQVFATPTGFLVFVLPTRTPALRSVKLP
jgi:hypothetical protein